MRQRLSNPKLKWWQGVLLILGIVFLLMAGELVGATVEYMYKGKYSYIIASVGFWLFGGIIALAVVRSTILEYEYTIEGLALRIDRYYSSKPRFAQEIILRNVVFAGTLTEAEDKYPSAPKTAYLRARNKTAELAVAFKDGDKIRIVRLQPEEQIREKIIGAAKANGSV